MKMLKALRIQEGLSGREMSQLAGINPSTLSLIESGRLVPYPSQLERISKALTWVRDPDLLLEEAALTKSTAVLKSDLDA